MAASGLSLSVYLRVRACGFAFVFGHVVVSARNKSDDMVAYFWPTLVTTSSPSSQRVFDERVA